MLVKVKELWPLFIWGIWMDHTVCRRLRYFEPCLLSADLRAIKYFKFFWRVGGSNKAFRKESLFKVLQNWPILTSNKNMRCVFIRLWVVLTKCILMNWPIKLPHLIIKIGVLQSQFLKRVLMNWLKLMSRLIVTINWWEFLSILALFMFR